MIENNGRIVVNSIRYERIPMPEFYKYPDKDAENTTTTTTTTKTNNSYFGRTISMIPSSSSLPSISSLNSSSKSLLPVTPPPRYKMKKYQETDKIFSVYHEMSKLNRESFTHVVNMPGRFQDVLYYARRFNIVVLDSRMVKYIADICSRRLASKN